jgi:hypothetical protein
LSASCSREEKTTPVEAAKTEPAKSETAKQSSDPNYRYQLTIREMTFWWKIHGDNLDVKLSAKTPGWLGIGFNPESGRDMKGANIIIGSVKDGEVNIEDHFGTLKTNHKPDDKVGGKPHVANPAGREEGDTTEISFSMPLKSGDAMDVPVDPAGDNSVLLAYGKSDIMILKHKFRAVLKVNLSTGRYTVVMVR